MSNHSDAVGGLLDDRPRPRWRSRISGRNDALLHGGLPGATRSAITHFLADTVSR
jgi:hypothetical protein